MSQTHPPIAIIGMASLFPGAPSLSAYWRNILDAADCISDVPDDHSWNAAEHHSDDPTAKDKTWCTRGGFLDKYPFDPIEFGIPPNILESIDTTQLLSLIVAREALIDAGMHPNEDHWDRDRVACILGITGTQEMAVNLGARLFGPTWRKALARCGVDPKVADAVVQDIGDHMPTWTEQSFPGLLGNVVTGRISNRFDLGGTNAVVDAACASSLAAMQYALSDLVSGRSDVVLTGGADCLNDAFMYQCFTRTPAFTKRGDATPFDAESDGILIGEGIAMIACKRLEDAERDGDRIYAVIKGLGSASDGRFKSIYAPNPDGQAKCLRRAYAMADVDPATVELIEAHGTGTKAGDVAEIAGLKQVFGDIERDGRTIQIGSVKAQIGHTKSTAGAAGLVKAVLALHHRVLPPAAKVTTPNPKMGFADSPFFLSPHARPWIRATDHKRRAGVSAFGFGGTNYHCVLEEYGDPNAVRPIAPAHGELFLFEADDAVGLSRHVSELPDGPTFAHRARATQEAFTGRRPHVLAFVASEGELEAKTAVAVSLIARGPGSRSDVHYGVHADPGKVAFVFPGQGSQYLEMGRDLAIRWPVVRAAFDAADDHFRKAGRKRLSARIFPPPFDDPAPHEATLRATEWAQPALGAVSKGFFDLLTSFGVRPDAVAGHSYGELVALHAAGALDGNGLREASRIRGEAMISREGTDRGTMAAVSGPLADIERVLTAHREVVLANRNHPEQGVISGPREAIDRAVTDLERKGLSAKKIQVSAAFHSPLVADAARPYATALERIPFKRPNVAVYANTTARPYPSRVVDMRRTLVDQITSPVDWVGTVRRMADDGVRVFVEVGPKAVLSNLVRTTLAGRDVTIVSLDRHRHRVDGDTQLKNALAQLITAGVPVDLAPLLAQPLPPPPPRGKSKATLPLGGANHLFEKTRNPPVTPAIEEARRISAARAAAPSAPASRPASPAPKPGVTAPRGPSQAPVASAPVSPQPRGTPSPGAPMNRDLEQLLQSTRATLQAFQSTQERTAAVHEEFLKAHAQANASFTQLFQTHARLVEMASTGRMPTAPSVAAALPPMPQPVAVPTTPAATPAAPAAIQQLAPSRPPAPMAGMMSTEAAALVGSFLGQGHKTPATMKLDGLDGAVAVSDQLPPLLDARGQATGNVAHATRPAPATRPVPPIRTAPAAPAPAPVQAGPDVQGAMFAAVAEKTGYPEDMLELEMDLEADLGIDSIKRVEILSAVQDRVPGMPELDNDRLSALRTLAEVVGYLAEMSGGSVAAAPAPTGASVAPVSGAPAASGPDRAVVTAAMFASVAEKTGYPEDMLELGMDLEADLGIDSIKRVEILSAVQDRVPGMPELDNDRLSALRTLDEVVGYLAEVSGATSAAPVAPMAPSGGGDKSVVTAAMFSSVAEKTGYPEDMLELGMDLEADLGIDSIKRVEILSAVQDRVPGMPELDNDRLSALRTLEEVVDYLAEVSGVSPGKPVAPAPMASGPMDGVTLLRQEVRTVRCGPSDSSVPAGRIVVTKDKGRKAQALVNELTRRGVQAELVDPDWSGDAVEVGPCDGVVHMACVGAHGDALLERVRGTFLLAKATGPVPYFATVSALGGDFGLTRCDEPLAGALAGFTKTLTQEWDGRFVAVDAHKKVTAKQLADALTAQTGALEVGVKADGLWRLHNAFVPMPTEPVGAPCAPGDLVVVSGGARGVTAAVVLEMARRYRPHLLLLGRSPLADRDPAWAEGVDEGGLRAAWVADARARGEKPSPKTMDRAVNKVLGGREVRQTLADIRATGATVDYRSVDIRDADSVGEAVASIGKPVVGFVHGAGVLADKKVTDKTVEMFDRVFSTKVDGLDALLENTSSKLKFAVMFASVAGRYGNIGQCDYAMANEVLTHTALQLAQRGVRAKSFDWGPWEAGMVTPALRKQFEARGLTVIPLREGAQFCCDELERGGGAVEVVVEGPRPTTGSRTRTITVADSPYLADHSIEGTPVVPVAMVLEWFADAARQCFPGMTVAAVEGLQVLKGIRVDGPTELTLSWAPTDAAPGEEALAMRLQTGSVPNYRATVRMAWGAERAPRFAGSNGLGGQAFRTKPYGRWLFHGPVFQGIEAVKGYSDHGIVGTLRSSTPDALGLGGAAWTTDPLAVDSALQLMLLWVGETQNARALPCAIRSYRQFKPFAGPVDCHLEMDRATARTGRFRATFVDATGEVVAELDAGEYAAR
jgi:acyl transferase domain-containing protein